MALIGEVGSVKLDYCMVPVVVGDHTIITSYSNNGAVLCDHTDKENPVVTDYGVNSDQYLGGIDDNIWHKNRACVTVRSSKRFTTLRFPMLEQRSDIFL